MIFTELKLKGAYLIEPELKEDERGFFARTWCRKEFEEHGLNTELAQCSISYNQKKGTLRGMHYQVAPHPETKLVRCTMGAIYDVIIDLRPDSQTFKEWVASDITAGNRRTLYVPDGFAHGFQTLIDDSEVFYLISDYHDSACSRGVRWNDPAFEIKWPMRPSIISARDSSFGPIDVDND